LITYVDTSTFVKVVLAEAGTGRARDIWDRAQQLVSVLLITVEAHAALARAQRERQVSDVQYDRAVQELDHRLRQLTLLAVGGMLVVRASELAVTFGLHGYDAVHLASAELAGAEVLTSADAALCAAARTMGFHVANPLDPA
jgi:predicted nucleic acid-binding protein